jgi:SMODS-associated and fused to various effectors sensor domain
MAAAFIRQVKSNNNYISIWWGKMSISHIPEKVKIRLWGKAAGRCQYDGCNKPLWLDSLTKAEFNSAYVAHIIADQPNGPRGHEKLSGELKADVSNLMLMCDEHHRLIDLEDVEGHPIEKLRQMKRNHEDRVELLTSIQKEKRSHVILYGANIGHHSTSISWDKAASAMIPERYPAEKPAIELSLKNSSFKDNEEDFWKIEREQLQRQFNMAVRPRLAMGDFNHFSIFGLAPQPLLIEFGRLLSDIPAAEVYQLHREPPGWKWQSHPENFKFIVRKPDTQHKTVALNLSLSATIEEARITSIIGYESSIWTLTVDNPHNDFLKSREQLTQFRQIFRITMDQIKALHGQDASLYIFPAVPVSVAVEIGRVWMPKSDLPMCVYDHNREIGGFAKALDIVSKQP